MGSGKTAVGKALARLLQLTFYDSDVEIERRTGVDIPYIFEREGEAGFRHREAEVIDELTQRENVLIATGGGAILDPASRARLRERGRVVYLRTSVDQQLSRTRLVNRTAVLQQDFQPERRLVRFFENNANSCDKLGT